MTFRTEGAFLATFLTPSEFTSSLQLSMLDNVECKDLCTKVIPQDDAKFINDRNKERYFHNWFVDGLPAALPTPDDPTSYELAVRNILPSPLGNEQGQLYFLNHFLIELAYHTVDEINYHIVGVTVAPYRIFNCLYSHSRRLACNFEDFWDTLPEDKDTTVTYSYSVRWKPSSVSWDRRYDRYLENIDPQLLRLHWFSITDTILMALFLAVSILLALRKDISRNRHFADTGTWYNIHVFARKDAGDDENSVLVLNVIQGDVFRPPAQRMLLAVLLGNGAQLVVMAATTLVLAVLGFLSPANRGSLPTVVLLSFFCFSSIAGYVSARVYKMLEGENWRWNVALTVTLLPGTLSIVLVILNFVLVSADSSGAVPIGTMMTLILLWFIVYVPLGALGAYRGFQAPLIEHPAKTNKIPREIPPPKYQKQWLLATLGGMICFSINMIELNFITKTIWSRSVSYPFGFLFIDFVLHVITSSVVSIYMCYFNLRAEVCYCSSVYVAGGGTRIFGEHLWQKQFSTLNHRLTLRTCERLQEGGCWAALATIRLFPFWQNISHLPKKSFILLMAWWFRSRVVEREKKQRGADSFAKK
ncbi:hypothetical protein BDK51DRAFT_21331 [Blyttiomyces helicus]|uniref:Transmembrane 9 superfamily member n=1 Tax=Blyttiomyces helicus TaxID=388810 RepID=A0A4P9W1X1_9FUNG|nr:hypothetical protein BDK51DRAFT_21331 [Blyttiomyces helicus]|eukprot:RKO85692.1 hypothetical protein BDK51DRAFT_21331 [Blyttiomyces helicus]